MRAAGARSVEFLPADLLSQAGVRALAAEVHARYPQLHVLINNAGTVFAERKLTEDGVERTFALNHLTPFLLTALLQDRLTGNGEPGRVVTVSSEAHRMLKTLEFDNLQAEKRFKPLRAYAVSKLANVLFTYELSRRLAGTGVTANCLHPGIVRTSIWKGAKGALWLMTLLLQPFMISATSGGAPVVKLASDPTLDDVTGRYYKGASEVPSSPVTYDEQVARDLWDVSEKLSGL